LERLSSNIIDLSRDDSDAFIMSYSHVDICKILREIVFAVNKSFPNLSFELDLPVGDKIGSNVVVCDIDKIERIIFNLISNSIKYAGDDCRIKISVEFEEENFTITYSDNGDGVEKEQLANLFEPFFQVDRSFTRIGKGSGIGLAVLKKFVEMHKGKVGCCIGEEGGLEFKINLPCNYNESADFLCQDRLPLDCNIARLVRLELTNILD
jgi:signal transduction histidine kinase